MLSTATMYEALPPSCLHLYFGVLHFLNTFLIISSFGLCLKNFKEQVGLHLKK